MCKKNRAKEYYKNNRDVILNRSKEYYINNKEPVLKHLKNKYESLTKIKNKNQENIEKNIIKNIMQKKVK